MFKTAEEIHLQPNDTKYGATFKFPIASSATSNDGALPFDTTISTVVVTGWYGDTEAPDLIYGTPTNTSDTVVVNLNYPTTTMIGVTGTVGMSLRFILTLSTGATLESDFRNINVGNIK